VSVYAVDGATTHRRSDHVATEEPLEIRVRPPGGPGVPVAVTMRTPGDDYELAAGFLYAEGVIGSRDDVVEITYCVEAEQEYNTVTAELTTVPDLEPTTRRGFVSSACGVCGKTTIDNLRRRGLEPAPDGPVLDVSTVTALPARLRAAQQVFDSTGGLHAAALFDPSGELVALREDVGRHNALDKLVGWALLEARLPLGEHVLLLSGRASFELLQKAVAARIPVVCAVGAPSSLAVDVARTFGTTLVGFLRDDRFNVYAEPVRIATD
jgi:FdhD protein